MPFSQSVKARIFVKSARICALCFKQCGTRIEAAHILAEADGGADDDDNAIPLCFDCHEDIGSYNHRHPKGNKFTERELRQRRDALYSLVERGIIQAQIVAQRIGARQTTSDMPATAEIVSEASHFHTASAEAVAVLQEAQKVIAPVETLPRKLGLVSREDRAFIIDQLVESAAKGPGISALMLLIAKGALENQEVVVLERLLRKVTLSGDVDARARFMNLVPVQTLANTEETMRSTFFEDALEIMRHDQYSEVNQLTPAVIRVQDAIPVALNRSYVEALLDQARSSAWQGGPAARLALQNLPASMRKEAYEVLDPVRLYQNMHNDFMKDVINAHKPSWPKARREIYSDFLALPPHEFAVKHLTESDRPKFWRPPSPPSN